MPTICLLAEHADADETDVRALQAIVSTWFKNKYGRDPEFLDILDFFEPKGDGSIE